MKKNGGGERRDTKMAFRINTNVASLSATLNAQSNQKDLSNSISRLSSGLRIQSAADDASGMYIADSLKSQSNSLYQAIRNGNDAIGIVQTADKAMDEQIKIIDTIRVKAIQAANDSQNVESRRAIQSDISRLLDELDNITNTTSFNGQKLLNGNFINKQFQIGAYSNETVKLSIENTHSKAIGHTHFLATSSLVFKDKDFEKTNFKMKLDAVPGFLEGIEFEPISGKEILNDGLGVIVDKINAYSDKTGVKAKVKNEFLSSALMFGTKFFQNSIQSLKINGELIGTNIKFETGDPDNVLIDAINAKSDTTGVKASNIGGRLSMIAEGGKPIHIEVGSKDDAQAMGISLGNNQNDTSVLILGQLYLESNNGLPPTLDLVETTNTIKGAEVGGLNAQKVDPQNIIGSQTAEKVSLSLNDIIRKNIDEHTLKAIGGFDLKNPTILELPGGVNTNLGAQTLMDITLNALRDLDRLRSDLGSTQNQLVTTINNITVTQVNIKAAESQIRDVDFAEESANFSKFNILAQSGNYAISQANMLNKDIIDRLLR